MRKVNFKRINIAILLLTASSLVLGTTTVFYYMKYGELVQNYSDVYLFSSSHDVSPFGNLTEVPNVLVSYPSGFQDYAKAILKICDTALSKYLEIFGMSTPDIQIFIFTNQEQVSLGCTANYRIFNYVRSIDDFKPPPNGPHHVYGFIHEIGHLLFMTDNGTFNEGWADYVAGFRIVSEVYRELGENVWPQPYNYSKIEGEERFLNSINDPNYCQPSTMSAAAKILYTIDQKYGATIFKLAIGKMHPTYVGMYHFPIYELEEFKRVLVDLTNDASFWELFSENGF